MSNTRWVLQDLHEEFVNFVFEPGFHGAQSVFELSMYIESGFERLILLPPPSK